MNGPLHPGEIIIYLAFDTTKDVSLVSNNQLNWKIIITLLLPSFHSMSKKWLVPFLLCLLWAGLINELWWACRWSPEKATFILCQTPNHSQPFSRPSSLINNSQQFANSTAQPLENKARRARVAVLSFLVILNNKTIICIIINVKYNPKKQRANKSKFYFDFTT